MARTMDKRHLPLKLLSLETEGFSYFPRQEIILHNGITVLNGENGSGKTTFLNMLRVLFGATRFDNGHTFKTFFERKDSHEIYIIGRFDNKLLETYGKRPFEGIGKTQDVVSVVCRLMNEQPVRRDYLIYDGVFELDVHAKGGLRWLEHGQYLNQMSDVGLSRALVNAFSFNQGNTEKLLEKSEEELAAYLLQICGEQERIEKFEQVKEDLRDLNRRFSQLEELKSLDESNIQRLHEKIQRCKQIVDKNEQLEQLRFDEPLARCWHDMKQLQEQNNQLSQLHRQLQALGYQIAKLEQDFVAKDEELNEVTQKLRELKGALKQSRERRDELKTNIMNWQIQLQELTAFLNEYKDIAELPIEQVELELKACHDELEGSLAERSILHGQKQDLEKKIHYIQTHKKIVYPPDVQAMLQKLKDTGIDHLLLAECVEIQDEEWREAIEALLGTERFTITVAEPDMVAVMKIAQQIKYPFWISPHKPMVFSPSSTSVLAKVAVLDERVTGYISKFLSYMTASSMEEAWDWVRKGKQAILHRPHPFKVVDRGGKWISAHGLYCGKLAYESQLKRLEEERGDLIPVYEAASNRVEEGKQQVALAERQLHVQQQVRLLPVKSEQHQEAQAYCTQLEDEEHVLAAFIAASETEQGQLQGRSDSLHHQTGELTASIKDKRAHLQVYQDNKAEIEVMVGVLTERTEAMKQPLSDKQKLTLYDSAYMEQMKPHDYYEQQIKGYQAIIDTLRGNGYDAIIEGEERKTMALEEKYATHQKILEQHLKEIEQVQSELKQLEQKHEEAEEEYRYMVEDVFSKIKRSLDELSQHTNMNVSLRAIHMGEQRWRVEYRIGFHGKLPSSYQNRSDFSGGQKVIASLLLTFAAVKADGVLSFMVLDEPFAHLDHERIKLVGEFLKKSDVQYIIAMPYTENLKLVMPWVDMLVNLRPKQAGEDIAPPFTYGGIDEEYVERHSLYHA